MESFLEIQKRLESELITLKKRKNLLSNIRLLFFILFAVTGYYYIKTDLFWLMLLALVLFAIFIIFVVKSSTVRSAISLKNDAIDVIELIKLDDRVDEYSHLNSEYFDNVYNKDLDILEGQSLFNRLNKTQSLIGNFQLKQFLSNVITNRDEILQRQESLKELQSKPNWITEFLTLSKRIQLSTSVIFGQSETQFKNQSLRFLPIIIGGINTLFFIYLAVIGFPKKAVFFWVVIAVPIGFILNFAFQKKINSALSYTYLNANQLENLIELFQLIENENFETKLNQDLKQGLIQVQKSSEQLKGVKASMESLEAVGFPIIGFLLNSLSLWKLYFTIQLEKRVALVVENNEQWIQNISTLEALTSFAIFNSKFKNFTTPIISTLPNKFVLDKAFHPLLDEETVVRNDFSTNRSRNVAIITGANMAGKSTFLRTIGTNLVLGMNGANVSAESMEFFPMDIFTSIRTVDNLASGDSYFKNEINKLRILIDRLENGNPQYVILDEILKGTNSQDKLIGSQKFLEKLINFDTDMVGFIATHDLELTKMEEQYNDNIINYCFELKNVNDHYFSDYKLIKGTTKVMNAIFLMKHFGIIE